MRGGLSWGEGSELHLLGVLCPPSPLVSPLALYAHWPWDWMRTFAKCAWFVKSLLAAESYREQDGVSGPDARDGEAPPSGPRRRGFFQPLASVPKLSYLGPPSLPTPGCSGLHSAFHESRARLTLSFPSSLKKKKKFCNSFGITMTTLILHIKTFSPA